APCARCARSLLSTERGTEAPCASCTRSHTQGKPFMTFWNLYFILKLFLFWTGHLKPIWLANLGFVAALALTSPIRQRGWRLLRFVVGLGIGLPLLYYEAVVPPFSRVVEEASAI